MSIELRKQSGFVWGHLIGWLAVLWAILAWAEWFLIPMFIPNPGGPLPYAAFIPQATLLLVGCVWFPIQLLLFPINLAWRWRVVYSILPASYCVFQLARIAGLA